MKDYTKIKFKNGRVKAIKFSHRHNRNTYWLFKCFCGAEFKAQPTNLIFGRTKGCGCTNKNIKHGMYRTKEYKAWESLKARCNNSNAIGYKNYGARGIKVCKRWKSFKYFYSDMGAAPTGGYIDRINNEQGYYPSNCRWVSCKESNLNKTNTVWLTHKGIKKPLIEWAKIYNITYSCALSRFKRGWRSKDILSQRKGRLTVKSIKYKNVKLSVKQWATKLNISYTTMIQRINRGLPVKQVLSKKHL